jgi:hypothetical protein
MHMALKGGQRRGLLVAATLGAVMAAAQWRPGCRPGGALRASLLRATPPGSDTAAVQREIARRRWPAARSRYGYILPRERGATGLPTVVGASSVRVELPEAVCPLPGPLATVSSEIRWAFDVAGRLVDIDVERTVDGP